MPLKKKKKVTKKKIVVKRKIIRKAAPKKKPAKLKTAKKIKKTKKAKEAILGAITHYFPKVRAAVIKLSSALSVGDSIKIKGHTTDFTQVISSMQIEHVSIKEAKKGQEIGLLVNSRVRQGDIVYKA